MFANVGNAKWVPLLYAGRPDDAPHFPSAAQHAQLAGQRNRTIDQSERPFSTVRP